LSGKSLKIPQNPCVELTADLRVSKKEWSGVGKCQRYWQPFSACRCFGRCCICYKRKWRTAGEVTVDSLTDWFATCAGNL